MENKKNNIEKFLNDFNGTLDSNKQISLYRLLKKTCPNTIRLLEKKINGKNSLIFLDKENKWYTAIINYLIKKEILESDRQNNGTTVYKVSEDYKKYFVRPVSLEYSPRTCPNHLILYSKRASEFLMKSGFVDNEGKEFISDITNEKKNKFISKHSKIIKIVFTLIMFISIINYILMVSKYGITQMTPFLCNTCLFVLSILVTTTKLD